MDVFNTLADMFRPENTETLHECKTCHAYYPALTNGECSECKEVSDEYEAMKRMDAEDILNEQRDHE